MEVRQRPKFALLTYDRQFRWEHATLLKAAGDRDTRPSRIADVEQVSHIARLLIVQIRA
jgi:hypothetical protein